MTSKNNTNNLKSLFERTQQFWRSARNDLAANAPKYIATFVEELPAIFASQEEDNERRERREVYVAMADALRKLLRQPLPLCLDVVHTLVGEKDPALLEAGAPAPEAMLAQARKVLLKTTVRYVRESARRNWREIEIYVLQDGQAARSLIREERAWEMLPADVRAAQLRDGSAETSFKLYPHN